MEWMLWHGILAAAQKMTPKKGYGTPGEQLKDGELNKKSSLL